MSSSPAAELFAVADQRAREFASSMIGHRSSTDYAHGRELAELVVRAIRSGEAPHNLLAVAFVAACELPGVAPMTAFADTLQAALVERGDR